jgi:hypothetical protein
VHIHKAKHFSDIYNGHHDTVVHSGARFSFVISHHATHRQLELTAHHFVHCLMCHCCNQITTNFIITVTSFFWTMFIHTIQNLYNIIITHWQAFSATLEVTEISPLFESPPHSMDARSDFRTIPMMTRPSTNRGRQKRTRMEEERWNARIGRHSWRLLRKS